MAADDLIEEIGRLRTELSTLAGQGLEEGIARLSVALAVRRLESLKAVLARCRVTDNVDLVAIGTRATLRDPDGQDISYEIVFPGDGEPDRSRISADSPLGGAILGSRPGDVVQVSGPAGASSVTLVAVE